ncbi:MAG TPA: hypothetical protein VIL85_08070 [Thermomicrobiales bacterium]
MPFLSIGSANDPHPAVPIDNRESCPGRVECYSTHFPTPEGEDDAVIAIGREESTLGLDNATAE